MVCMIYVMWRNNVIRLLSYNINAKWIKLSAIRDSGDANSLVMEVRYRALVRVAKHCLHSRVGQKADI